MLWYPVAKPNRKGSEESRMGQTKQFIILSLLQGILMREKRIEKKFVTDIPIKMIFLFWIFSERR